MKNINLNIKGKKFKFEEQRFGFFKFENNGKIYYAHGADVKFNDVGNFLTIKDEDYNFVKTIEVNWAEQYLFQLRLEAIKFERSILTTIKSLIMNGQEVNEHSTVILAQQAFHSLKIQISKLSGDKFIKNQLVVNVNEFHKYFNVTDERKPSTPWHNGWDEESKDWGRDLNAIL
jgi:hypothetical protein